MRIYIYKNRIQNYCFGDFYFIAENQKEADKIAGKFMVEHNSKVEQNRNYTVEWEKFAPKSFPVKPGYLPLNRIQMDMQK